MDRQEIMSRVESLRSSLESRWQSEQDRDFPKLPERVSVEIDYGPKYARIRRNGSAAGFVDMTTGGILYAGSYKGPQDKRPRGTVLADDFGLSAFGRYAVHTLR